MDRFGNEAKNLIKLLEQGDFYCECPCGECGGRKINLKNTNLFYGENFTPAGLEAKSLIIEHWKQSRSSLESRRLHKASHTRSVNVGLISEKIITILRDFKFEHNDCRSIFKPIDFLIFEGLSKVGRISKIFFVEVKSGNNHLNQHQKDIKELVDKKRVEFKTY